MLDVYADRARKAAAASTARYKAGKPLSPLDGVPIGVKANIAVKGEVCHGGIKAYAKTRADKDADVVANLRASGAVILGSLNMEEGALGAQTDNPWFGKTHNPLKHGYTPGGSSGGSAAAVAAGMMPAALGTDTMGSVRIPSAYCGLSGHKPTQTLLSKAGLLLLSPTLDCIGPHARTPEDAALMLAGMSGKPNPQPDLDMSKLRIGVLDFDGVVDIEDGVAAGFDNMCESLRRLGGQTLPVKFDGYDFSKARRAGLLISEIEGAEVHLPQYEQNPHGFSEHFQSLLTWGVMQSAEKCRAAYALIDAQKARAADVFKSCDLLLAPTAPQTAFKFGTPVPAGQADFTAFANFAGLPATAIPSGTGKNGLPVSVQIIGPQGADALCFAMAAKLFAK